MHFERSRRQCSLGGAVRGRFFGKILKFKPSEMAFPGILHRPISCQEKFPRTENFPKISFVSAANHILQNFLSAENFPEWKWALRFWRFCRFIQIFNKDHCVKFMLEKQETFPLTFLQWGGNILVVIFEK
jgi:hypothetical protein